MFIDKDSIIINNISMGQYLLSVEYDHNKLWGTDTGRNQAGNMIATFVGIFPKLILTFRKLTKAEMNIVAPILDSESQSVTYYDPATNQNETISTYTGDWNYTNKKIVNNKQDGTFQCSFIARERRS